MIGRYGQRLRVRSLGEIASLPLLMLLVSLVLFVASPVVNAVSRHQEHTADVYALELTQEPEAAIVAFQEHHQVKFK